AGKADLQGPSWRSISQGVYQGRHRRRRRRPHLTQYLGRRSANPGILVLELIEPLRERLALGGRLLVPRQRRRAKEQDETDGEDRGLLCQAHAESPEPDCERGGSKHSCVSAAREAPPRD